VALIVRHHHERVDGSGYPAGLSGVRIPVASRIMAVCDAYGAMTEARPYRDERLPHEALEELRHQAGSQFDPAVVEALEAEVGVAVLQTA
jgi:HD-GYP domain-containing protein (c-di-GMP phosphodiesterase class II)